MIRSSVCTFRIVEADEHLIYRERPDFEDRRLIQTHLWLLFDRQEFIWKDWLVDLGQDLGLGSLPTTSVLNPDIWPNVAFVDSTFYRVRFAGRDWWAASMPANTGDRDVILAVPGIGPAAVGRFEPDVQPGDRAASYAIHTVFVPSRGLWHVGKHAEFDLHTAYSVPRAVREVRSKK